MRLQPAPRRGRSGENTRISTRFDFARFHEARHGWPGSAERDPEKRVDTPLVIITAHGTIERAVETMKEGADDFLTKPFDPDHLSIDRLFALNHLKTTTGCSERILLLHEGGFAPE